LRAQGRRVAPIRHVDIFLRRDLSYQALLPDTEWVDLGGFAVRILSFRLAYSGKQGNGSRPDFLRRISGMYFSCFITPLA
jgi:hypothetical protein